MRETVSHGRSVGVGIGTDGMQEAFVCGRDYHDVLRKIDELRKLALEALERKGEIPF